MLMLYILNCHIINLPDISRNITENTYKRPKTMRTPPKRSQRQPKEHQRGKKDGAGAQEAAQEIREARRGGPKPPSSRLIRFMR